MVSRIAVCPWVFLCVAALCTLPGCAVSKPDTSAKEWDRAQCNQIIPERERKRCLERVDAE